MKTIRRNAHRKIAAIALTIVKVRAYDQVRGGTVDLNEGTTAASAVASVLAHLNDPYSGAKLHDNEDGSYTVHVHSNLYYYLYTQAHLDQLAADQAARQQRAAAHPRPANVPTREQRQARIEARTVSIHDLGKPVVSDLYVRATQGHQQGTVYRFLGIESGREPMAWLENPAGGRQCISKVHLTHVFEAVCEHGNSPRTETCLGCGTEDMEGNQAEESPAVTVTRTRMAIGDQISQACTALGIKLGHGWNNGYATYLVQGREYTAGELADLVLVGGFAANYGGNTVNVNWNCPLVPGRTQENRAGRALMITRELQARMGTATARELEEVAQSLMDMLHEWAIEDAPAPRVDFLPGAAEPDFDVMAVTCVRTGDVWLRRERGWVSGDRWATWYSLNLIDPMSEGFNVHRKES